MAAVRRDEHRKPRHQARSTDHTVRRATCLVDACPATTYICTPGAPASKSYQAAASRRRELLDRLIMEAPLLLKRPRSDDGGDAAAPRSYAEAREAFLREAERLWAIAAPITLNILCLYGVNSATQIIAGWLANLQLSAAALGLRRLQVLLRLPPRHGQRARDALRPGLRRRPGGRARPLHAALPPRPRHLRAPAFAAQ